MTAGTSAIDAALADERLDEAIALVTARLRASPADPDARLLLAELLCLAGEFERADKQLTILAEQDDARPVRIASLRHLLRAATARDAWYLQGAVPALLAAPTPLQRAAMALSVAMRDGGPDAIAAALAEAEALRPVLNGEADGAAFSGLREADDRSAWFLDVFSQDGGYLWVEWSRVATLRFAGPPRRPIDLLWREARLVLHDGTEADIVVPAQYVAADATAAQRLARATDWEEGPGGVVSGRGQRVWLVGDEPRDLLSLGQLVFAAAP